MSAYPIPDAALDDRLAFIGTSGSGKTYGAGTAAEKLLSTGAKVIIVDPLGVWWGLRLSADGKSSGFELPIFGGPHGDLPLNDSAGKLIGETVASMRESCIVDLSGLQTKEAERRFMLAFLDALYRHAAGDLMHAIFDEADLWAPQNPSKQGAGPQLQSLMEQIVRRGRVRGFIPWLITQRPAVISKDVLSQADGLVAFKLTASQDRKAIGDWVRGQADEGQWPIMDAELPRLQRGEALVWLPGHGKLELSLFPAKATFDSSQTPKRGEKKQRRDLKPLDLEGLKGRLASIEEEAKANDPRALKAEVARLTCELAQASKAAAPSWPDQREEVRQLMDAIVDLRGYVADIDNRLKRIRKLTDTDIAVLDARTTHGAPCTLTEEPTRIIRDGYMEDGKTPAPRQPKARIRNESVPAEGITGPQQRILDAIAWWEAFGIDRPTNEQVAFMSGYAPSSGGYKNPKSAARTAGLIEYPSPGLLCLTELGRAQASAPDAPTTREELHRRVNERLSGPQRAILAPLLDAYPDQIANDDLATAAGYSPTSGGYKNPKSSLRTLTVLDYPSPGQVRAADWLFP